MFYKDRLQNLRNRNGITYDKLGSIINLDRGTYCHYEKEDLIIPMKHLNTICNYFDVSIDYIFNFTNIKQYENSKKEIDPKVSGIRLKKFRKEQKLTLKKLASIINYSYGTIAGYELGHNIISTPFLYEICSEYKISADYLLGKVDKPMYLK